MPYNANVSDYHSYLQQENQRKTAFKKRKHAEKCVRGTIRYKGSTSPAPIRVSYDDKVYQASRADFLNQLTAVQQLVFLSMNDLQQRAIIALKYPHAIKVKRLLGI